jgi:hypothetical protein
MQKSRCEKRKGDRMKNMVLVATVFIMAGIVGAETVNLPGRIDGVIVYRGQALVTRMIDLKLPAGSHEVIVGNLPEKIVAESLYSQAPENVTILSVRYRQRAVQEDTREEVKQVDLLIEQTETKIRLAKGDEEHLGRQLARLDKLTDFTAAAEKSDLNRGMLQYDPLEKTATFIEGKADDYQKKLVAVRESLLQLAKELELAKRKRGELAAGYSRTEREAVIFMNKSNPAPSTIELTYLVNDASWTPQYNLRSTPDKSLAVIEYNAVVHQSSGETWEGINLALSTAEPTLVANAPILDPLKIALREGIQPPGMLSLINVQSAAQPADQQGKVAQLIDQTAQFDDMMKSRRDNLKKGKLAQVELNSLATSNQMFEFNADKQSLVQMQQRMAVIKRTEGVSVMYKLPGKLALPSRSDQQLLTIAVVRTKAEFTLVATPLLTDYVYLQGEMVNDSDTILLPGPASMYRNNEFVGKGEMGLVTIGQPFTAGFGIDSQVQVVREFKDKKVETLWGNRNDEQQYRIELSNYKNQAVKLRLLERIPYADNPNVEVALLPMSHELSKDTEYARTVQKKGILRWDLTLPAGTTGEKATVVTYGFTMKYDKNMHIEMAGK